MNFKLFSYIAIVSLVASTAIWIHHKGYASCQADNAKQAVKESEVRNEIEDKVSRNTGSVNRDGLRKWSRG